MNIFEFTSDAQEKTHPDYASDPDYAPAPDDKRAFSLSQMLLPGPSGVLIMST
nr:hypothetical protein BgiMline_012249 [Biomphalaria glabrata]